MDPERGLHVFIVDDEEDLRLGVRLNFEIEGYTVSHACDGVEALELLRGGLRPDVILLDVQMPRMDGWNCLREIRNDPALKDIPVVLFTAKDEDQDRSEHDVKPDMWLVRPVGPITLLNAVRKVTLRE